MPCATHARRASRVRALCVALLLALLPRRAAAPERSLPVVVKAVARAAAQAPLPHAPYTLAACAVFHNEAPYLYEWVVYHFLIGVQHFYLYDNDSTDAPLTELQPLIKRGLVTYIPWPGEKAEAQGRQLHDCFNSKRASDARWMLGIDIDEFLVVVSHELSEEPFWGRDTFVLHDVLRTFIPARMGAVIMDRLGFNCNGHREATGGLVTRDFTHRTVSLRRPRHMVGKPLVLMTALEQMRGAHEVVLHTPWKTGTADRAEWRNKTRHRTFEPFRVNHYATRSYAECIAKSTSEQRHKSNGRKVRGARRCDKAMIGTKRYRREENAPEVSLAVSGLPDAVDAVRRLLPPAAKGEPSRGAMVQYEPVTS